MKKINFLYGDSENSIQSRWKELVQKLGGDSLEAASVNIDKFYINKLEDLETLLLKETSFSLLSKKNALILIVSNKGFKQVDKMAESFFVWLNSVVSYNLILICLIVEKADKHFLPNLMATNFLKEITKIANVEQYFKLKPWQYNEIKELIKKKAVKTGLEFDVESLESFYELHKDKIECIDAELDLLSIFLLPEKKISIDVLNRFYVKVSTIDELYKGLLNKNYSSSYEKVFQSLNVLYVFAALQSKLRQALLIKSCMLDSMSVLQISKKININQYILKKEISMLQNTSILHLKNLLENISSFEFKIKTGQMPEQVATQMLVLKAM